MTSTRKHEFVETRDVGGCFNSQTRTVAGTADHQHLLFPLAEVGKIHLYGWHSSDRCALPMKGTCVIYSIIESFALLNTVASIVKCQFSLLAGFGEP
ncbi:hypothetical protein TNCV_1968331 [Trichonephila clavipes]|nr:hypothetical protein TNCV_1968331 [Trichonephila clavipes]